VEGSPLGTKGWGWLEDRFFTKALPVRNLEFNGSSNLRVGNNYGNIFHNFQQKKKFPLKSIFKEIILIVKVFFCVYNFQESSPNQVVVQIRSLVARAKKRAPKAKRAGRKLNESPFLFFLKETRWQRDRRAETAKARIEKRGTTAFFGEAHVFLPGHGTIESQKIVSIHRTA
jgi:hypothetical protein